MSGETWDEVTDQSTDWDGGAGYVSDRYVANGYVRGFERDETPWADESGANTTWTGV